MFIDLDTLIASFGICLFRQFCETKATYIFVVVILVFCSSMRPSMAVKPTHPNGRSVGRSLGLSPPGVDTYYPCHTSALSLSLSLFLLDGYPLTFIIYCTLQYVCAVSIFRPAQLLNAH